MAKIHTCTNLPAGQQPILSWMTPERFREAVKFLNDDAVGDVWLGMSHTNNAIMLVTAFSDPNSAFEFKIRFV